MRKHRKSSNTNRKIIAFFMAILSVISLNACGSSSVEMDNGIEDSNSIVTTSEKIEKTPITTTLETTVSNTTAVTTTVTTQKNIVSTLTSISKSTTSVIEKEDHPPLSETNTIYEELNESEGDNNLTLTQKNSINMLNYITVLTQEINDSKGSRLYLESVYSSLINNIYPNSVDNSTQIKLNDILDTLESYRMIDVKRERLEFIYEQNKAQAIRSAIPNPVALLSTVESKNMLKSIASILYMAVDSVSSYESAVSESDLQHLKEGWELDDDESDELYNSLKSTFNYMLDMVNDNGIPGEYSLNIDSVKAFVEWKNNTNNVRKLSWLIANEDTYSHYCQYWLELARTYYNSDKYTECLESIEKYNEIKTRLFRRDYEYANILPLAIVSAKETLNKEEYVSQAEKFALDIIDNTDNTTSSDWALRYYVAETYIDLYKITNDKLYLNKAYNLAYDNVNLLVDEQKFLNQSYLSEIQEKKASKDLSKREKNEIKQYNKLIKEERKTALPPVSEALYLNCDLLFFVSDELKITNSQKEDIESILHDNGDRIFLTEYLDNRFWFNKESIDINNIDIEFDKDEICIPVSCITDKSKIVVTVFNDNEKAIYDNWTIEEVNRPKKSRDCSKYIATFTCKELEEQKFKSGQKIQIEIIPVSETPEVSLSFYYNVTSTKKLFVINSINFERIYS